MGRLASNQSVGTESKSNTRRKEQGWRQQLLAVYHQTKFFSFLIIQYVFFPCSWLDMPSTPASSTVDGRNAHDRCETNDHRGTHCQTRLVATQRRCAEERLRGNSGLRRVSFRIGQESTAACYVARRSAHKGNGR